MSSSLTKHANRPTTPPPLLGGGSCYDISIIGNSIYKTVKSSATALRAAIAAAVKEGGSSSSSSHTIQGVVASCSHEYQPHSSHVLWVDATGDYIANYVMGPTLQQVCENPHSHVPASQVPAFLAALDACLVFLRGKQTSAGAVDGDWALHNVVWDAEMSRVVNIDMEGFFTYPHWRPQIVNVVTNVEKWFAFVSAAVPYAHRRQKQT